MFDAIALTRHVAQLRMRPEKCAHLVVMNGCGPPERLAQGERLRLHQDKHEIVDLALFDFFCIGIDIVGPTYRA